MESWKKITQFLKKDISTW